MKESEIYKKKGQETGKVGVRFSNSLRLAWLVFFSLKCIPVRKTMTSSNRSNHNLTTYRIYN